MRVYGLNVYERALTDYLAAVSLLLLGFTVAAAIVPSTLAVRSTASGGLLVGAVGAAGLILMLAGAGVRQNRAALDLGQGLLVATGIAWIAWSAAASRATPLAAGVVMAIAAAISIILRQRSVRARFKPRFLSPRQFETMVAVADTMIEGDGREAIHPIAVAVNVDHLLAATDSPSTGQIRLVLIVLEWLLPLLVWRPLPFSSLGSTVRRQTVRRVIGSRGVFRAIARTLKVLSCYGYYGTAEGMTAIGYVAFEERPRFRGIDTTPFVHPDPFATRKPPEHVSEAVTR